MVSALEENLREPSFVLTGGKNVIATHHTGEKKHEKRGGDVFPPSASQLRNSSPRNSS